MISKVDIANKIGPYADWWLYLWGIVSIGLLITVFLIPFWIWAIAAIVGFGTMEGFGLATEGPYPPLTDIVRAFLPDWIAIPLMWMFTVAAGCTWLHIHHPFTISCVGALLGWFTIHFINAYNAINKLKN